MRDYTAFDRALAETGAAVLQNEEMAAHTTFKIGGCADRFIRVENKKMLTAVLHAAAEHEVPFLLLGNGSNLLVPDDGLRGAVLTLEGDFKAASMQPDGLLHAGAGATLASVCALARREARTGLEFAWGIPGTLGGAVYMNAGAYGGEMQQVVDHVEYLLPTGEMRSLSGDALGFGYRKSVFTDTHRIILSAALRLEKGVDAEISALMEELMRRRRDKQPVELPSAGSVFKRPEGHYAGALIELCGLKGFSIGGAAVSEKHAGFIVNRGGATCADVEALIAHIQETVLKETGVELEPEIRRVSL